MAKCAVFDMDGTIVDSIKDLANSCDYTLNKYGVKSRWTEEDYKQLVGNGMLKLIERAFDGAIEKKELPNALIVFKENYEKTCLNNTKPYDDIVFVLDSLKKMGVKIAVVTNKAHESALQMLDILFGKDYFDVVIGQQAGIPTKPNPAGLLKALEVLECSSNDAIYFGDSNVDIITAKNAKVESVGVTWGFRGFAELFRQNPDVIIDEPKQILKLF